MLSLVCFNMVSIINNGMNNYCYHFKDTINAIDSLEHFVAKNARLIEMYNPDSNVLSKIFLEKLNTVAPVGGIKVFYNPPNTSSFIHTDINDRLELTMYAVNIVLTPDQPGSMEWYHTDVKKIHRFSPNGAPSINYSPHDVTLAHTTVISTTPVLVRTDKPHRVISGAGNRACISIRFKQKFESWEEVVRAFSDAGL